MDKNSCNKVEPLTSKAVNAIIASASNILAVLST